jgi:hypothetical protein
VGTFEEGQNLGVYKIAQTRLFIANSLLDEGTLWKEASMVDLQTDGAQVFARWHNEGLASHPKRPRDPARLAKLMIDIASGEVEDRPTVKQIRAHKAGSKDGPSRAKALTPEQRSEIARTAAAARWKKGR